MKTIDRPRQAGRQADRQTDRLGQREGLADRRQGGNLTRGVESRFGSSLNGGGVDGGQIVS